MDNTENIERFKTICSSITRPGIESLMEWMESSDFYTAPASSKYHGAEPGGLLAHSLNVYDELNRLVGAYPEIEVPEESIAVAALFHDVCKVNFYKTEIRHRKNDVTGVWESYEAYAIDEKFHFGGHGAKSVFLIQNYMKLTPQEAVAIQNHMGAYDDPQSKYASAAFEQYPFAFLLHVADSAAAFIREGKTGSGRGDS